MNKKYSKIILQAITSIIFCITVLFSGCSRDYDTTVTIHFNGNHISANMQQKNIIDRILSFFSKSAYAAWSIPCNRLTLTISGPEIDQQFNDTGYIDTGINEHTFTAVVPAVDNVTFKVLSYGRDATGGEATSPNWGASRIVSLRPGNQTIDMAMLPMTSISGITMVDDGSLKVSFEKITNFCSGYNIYRSTEENGNYEFVGDANSDATSFSHLNHDISKTYYRVQVINDSEQGVLSDAMYLSTYTVTFRNNDNIIRTETVFKGAKVTATEYGGYYDFVWFKDVALTERWIFATTVTDDITLYGKMEPSRAVGDEGPGRGIIFYVEPNGFNFYTGTGDVTEKRYYLEVALVDELNIWGENGGSFVTSNLLGHGLKNTQNIIINDNTGNNTAAQKCTTAGYGGYYDWFLPSINELDLLYLQRVAVGITGGEYWSSTENNGSSAKAYNFSSGIISNKSKTNTGQVRAIRAF